MEINKILDDVESRRSFLMGLVFIAKADGVVDAEEIAFFKNAAVAMNLDAASLKQVDACWQLEECPPLHFSNVEQKKFFIREAIELSRFGSHYADEERALVRKFAVEFGVHPSVVESLEKWVEEGVAWRMRGDKLVLDAE